MTDRKRADQELSFFKRVQVFLVGLLGSLLLRALSATYRWRFVRRDGGNGQWGGEAPRAIVFWHGHQLFMPWLYRKFRTRKGNRPVEMLISRHADGKMIATAMYFLGIQTIPGSSTRGGQEALFQLIQALERGSHIGITPDGPKGPKHKLKAGAIRVAQRAGVPIHPYAIGAEKKWTFGSWDGMFLPKPFSRVVGILGAPVPIPAELSDEDVETYRLKVEDALKQITQEAENFVYDDSPRH